MKAFTKLSLLLALVVTGRLLRPSAPTATAQVASTTTVAAKPDALRFTFFTGTQTPEAVPVNHRTDQRKAETNTESAVWF